MHLTYIRTKYILNKKCVISEKIQALTGWTAHGKGCPIYGMAYRHNACLSADVTRDNDEGELLPERLYTSSCGGEVKEWDPSDGSLKQITIIKVGNYNFYCLIRLYVIVAFSVTS